METLTTRGHFSPQISKSTGFREIPHCSPGPGQTLGHGGLRRHIHSYAALLPIRDEPDRRPSQCHIVSTPRHFLAFLNYSRLNELKSTISQVYLLHPRHSARIERI